MTNAWTPDVLWDTAHVDGTNLVIHLDAGDPRRHLAVIHREVLHDALATSGDDLVAVALRYRTMVDEAIAKAWDPDRLIEAFEINGPRRNVQLLLTTADFS